MHHHLHNAITAEFILLGLREYFSHMPTGDYALPVQLLKQYTYATILYLQGGQLLSDTSDNRVKLMYLLFLSDLDVA